MSYSSDKKIEQLDILTSLATDDYLIAGDTSDSGRAKAITKANFTTDMGDETQTLTNKTIALGSNTVSGTTAQFNAALTDGDFATGGGTVTGASSGTNTGDQTSIVGITGTMAQFDTAVSDGNIVYQGQALGTPSSGVATNLTGTAASLTAGNVTTNANLTGAVTSVGNATSLGSFTLAQLNTAISDADVPSVTTASKASTFTFNGTGSPGTSGSVTMNMQKVGNWVTIRVPQVQATTGTTSFSLVSNTAVDATYIPAATQYSNDAEILNNGAGVDTLGHIRVGTDGIVTIFRDRLGTPFTNAASAGLNAPVSFTYYLG